MVGQGEDGKQKLITINCTLGFQLPSQQKAVIKLLYNCLIYAASHIHCIILLIAELTILASQWSLSIEIPELTLGKKTG